MHEFARFSQLGRPDKILIFMNSIDAMRKFFESMVTFKVSSIISTLTNLQVQLISKKDTLSPEEMDVELNKLEDVRRILQQKTGSLVHPKPDEAEARAQETK